MRAPLAQSPRERFVVRPQRRCFEFSHGFASQSCWSLPSYPKVQLTLEGKRESNAASMGLPSTPCVGANPEGIQWSHAALLRLRGELMCWHKDMISYHVSMAGSSRATVKQSFLPFRACILPNMLQSLNDWSFSDRLIGKWSFKSNIWPLEGEQIWIFLRCCTFGGRQAPSN